MDIRLFITGNFRCGECGNMLVPELEHEDEGAALTGRIFLTRHSETCSLRNKIIVARLPETKGELTALQEAAA